MALLANDPSDGLLSIVIQTDLAKSDTLWKKCVRKLYLLNTSTFITKVLSNLPSQADGHDLVIAAFVRVPESTLTDSRAELRNFLTTDNSVLQ